MAKLVTAQISLDHEISTIGIKPVFFEPAPVVSH